MSWNNRWAVIFQSSSGDEQIVDQYLSKEEATEMVKFIKSGTTIDGEVFIKDITRSQSSSCLSSGSCPEDG